MYRDCCVALSYGAKGLSAVCDIDISRSYAPTNFTVPGIVGVENHVSTHQTISSGSIDIIKLY